MATLLPMVLVASASVSVSELACKLPAFREPAVRAPFISNSPATSTAPLMATLLPMVLVTSASVSVSELACKLPACREPAVRAPFTSIALALIAPSTLRLPAEVMSPLMATLLPMVLVASASVSVSELACKLPTCREPAVRSPFISNSPATSTAPLMATLWPMVLVASASVSLSEFACKLPACREPAVRVPFTSIALALIAPSTLRLPAEVMSPLMATLLPMVLVASTSVSVSELACKLPAFREPATRVSTCRLSACTAPLTSKLSRTDKSPSPFTAAAIKSPFTDRLLEPSKLKVPVNCKPAPSAGFNM